MRKFFLALTLLSLSVSTGAIAQQQQRSGTPEEQKACARRPALLPTGDGSGRLHCPGLPSATSSQVDQACDLVLRTPGSSTHAHPIMRRCSPVIPLNLTAVGAGEKSQQSIGFGDVFPYMGFAALSACADDRGCEIPVPRPM